MCNGTSRKEATYCNMTGVIRCTGITVTREVRQASGVVIYL